MKSSIATIVLAIASLTIVSSGCDKSSARSEEKLSDTISSSEPAARVSVIRPQRKNLERRCDQPGEIMPLEETPIYAKIAGYVQSVNVDIGDRITKDQPLVILFVPELIEELKQKDALVVQADAQIEQARAAVEVALAGIESAHANVAAAQAAITRTTAALERWKSESSRIDELAERSAVNRKVADEALEQFRASQGAKQEAEAQVTSARAAAREAEAKSTAAKADVVAAEARLTVAKADYDRVKALTDYATIKAPYDGAVTQRLVHTGHFVQPAVSGRDQSLLVVQHSDVVRVVVYVPEADAGYTKPGAPASIRVQSLDKPLTGTVKRVASALDTATRTLRAEIELDNSAGQLSPGMYAYVSVLVAQRNDALVIPAIAVLSEQGKSYCLTVADGRIARTPIEIGLRAGGDVEVTSGLTGEQQIVPKNQSGLHEGQPAEIAK
jgi:HlyD family secretion protein